MTCRISDSYRIPSFPISLGTRSRSTGTLLGDGTLDDRDALASAVIVALGTDRLAEEGDLLPDPDSMDRRGWWGDYDADMVWDGWPIGCRLWLLQREQDRGAGLAIAARRSCGLSNTSAKRSSHSSIGASRRASVSKQPRVGKERIDALHSNLSRPNDVRSTCASKCSGAGSRWKACRCKSTSRTDPTCLGKLLRSAKYAGSYATPYAPTFRARMRLCPIACCVFCQIRKAHCVISHFNMLTGLLYRLLPDTAETEWLDRHGDIWLVNADGTSGPQGATLATGVINVYSARKVLLCRSAHGSSRVG